jgi:hypothetical protein
VQRGGASRDCGRSLIRLRSRAWPRSWPKGSLRARRRRGSVARASRGCRRRVWWRCGRRGRSARSGSGCRLAAVTTWVMKCDIRPCTNGPAGGRRRRRSGGLPECQAPSRRGKRGRVSRASPGWPPGDGMEHDCSVTYSLHHVSTARERDPFCRTGPHSAVRRLTPRTSQLQEVPLPGHQESLRNRGAEALCVEPFRVAVRALN